MMLAMQQADGSALARLGCASRQQADRNGTGGRLDPFWRCNCLATDGDPRGHGRVRLRRGGPAPTPPRGCRHRRHRPKAAAGRGAGGQPRWRRYSPGAAGDDSASGGPGEDGTRRPCRAMTDLRGGSGQRFDPAAASARTRFRGGGRRRQHRGPMGGDDLIVGRHRTRPGSSAAKWRMARVFRRGVATTISTAG